MLGRLEPHIDLASLPVVQTWGEFGSESLSASAQRVRLLERFLGLITATKSPLVALPEPLLPMPSWLLALVQEALEQGLELRLVRGGDASASVWAATTAGRGQQLQIVSAEQRPELNPLLPALVLGVDSSEASDVERWLLKTYRDDQLALVLVAADGDLHPVSAMLSTLSSTIPSSGGSLYLPATAPERAIGSHHGLRGIVHRLRAPGGCPWDREQTPVSLLRYVMEEAFEAVDAVEQGEPGHIAEELAELDAAIAKNDSNEMEEELGDVLFALVNLARHLPAAGSRRQLGRRSRPHPPGAEPLG
jgi:tetrapyrrole methylase family protein/MazG family protein